MRKNVLMVMLALMVSAVVCASPLANENDTGLYVRSIHQVMRLDPDEVDIGTAALIVAEEWSELVHGRKYQQKLDDIAYEVQSRIAKKGLKGKYQAVQVLNDYLFNDLGFG
ncbi:MAG: transglutaminase-like domain-containing protein, partial [Candidatus Cloacimonetes bacterium]|nr:transglutaminase-like domain-containing protein [Candidatus Cloacimonadota bacterium]